MCFLLPCSRRVRASVNAWYPHRFVRESLLDKTVLLNVEYSDGNDTYVSVADSETKTDLLLEIITAGFLFAAPRRESFLKPLYSEYSKAQTAASSGRFGMWKYGDVSQEDDKEFGAKK
eukprot:m.211077 g.211077  ORF g.211077 m.211077 type:complete len:118 (+) comp53969_c0_seq1:2403-2756(+)